MPVIDSALFQNMSDSIAAREQDLQTGFQDAASGIGFYLRIHDSLDDKFGDADVEGDLVTPANELDLDYQSGTTLSTVFGPFVRALQSHIQTVGSFTNTDAYLQSNALNVHEDFAQVYEATFGSKLDAINVYRKNELDMGTVDFSGSGVCVFTDGGTLGTGAGDFDGSSNSAAQALKAVVTSAGGIGSNDAIIKVVTLDEASVQQISTTLTIPNTAVLDDEFDIVITNPSIDVTAIQCAGGNASDQITIRQKVERPAVQ